MVVDIPSHPHDATFFPSQCCRGGGAAPALPARDGPIVPSNCKTHLTCKPVHPNRPDFWNSAWSDWLSSAGLILGGSVVAIGSCIYGKSVIDRNRKKRRAARMKEEGRRPPSEGGSDDSDSEDDLRGERG